MRFENNKLERLRPEVSIPRNFLLSLRRKSTLIFLLLLGSCIHSSSPLITAVSAHRGRTEVGTHQGVKDNTIEAILLAASYANLIEIDVRRTVDGYFVLMHESKVELEGTTQEVSRVTYGALAGAIGKPTLLTDALEALTRHAAAYSLDVKGYSVSLLSKLLPILQKDRRRLIVQCSSISCLIDVRRQDIALPVMVRLHSRSALGEALNYRASIIQVDEEWLTGSDLELAHLFHTPVLVKTLFPNEDNEARWKHLRDKGIDLILTDYPDRAVRLTD